MQIPNVQRSKVEAPFQADGARGPRCLHLELTRCLPTASCVRVSKLNIKRRRGPLLASAFQQHEMRISALTMNCAHRARILGRSPSNIWSGSCSLCARERDFSAFKAAVFSLKWIYGTEELQSALKSERITHFNSCRCGSRFLWSCKPFCGAKPAFHAIRALPQFSQVARFALIIFFPHEGHKKYQKFIIWVFYERYFPDDSFQEKLTYI